MASAGIRNPLSPYDNYRDCSLGICSIYCTQFCYFIFPPPPPSGDATPRNPLSPLIIAVIGVLVGAFLLVSYYTILTKFCKTRRGNDHRHHRSNDNNNNTEGEENRDGEWPVGPAGMDASLIGKITVCEYKKGGGLIEGTECAVCLSEFREDESLRLLPKCSHAFHLPCIDTWLKSQSSCPLCRANVTVSDSQASTAVDVDVSAYAVTRPDDLVLVVDDRVMERTLVISGDVDEEEGRDNEEGSSDHEGVEQFRRPVSFDTFSSAPRQLFVSDILKFEDIDEYVRVEIDGLWRGIGSSEGDGHDDKGIHGNLLRSPVAMKRSIGRFRPAGLWAEARPL